MIRKINYQEEFQHRHKSDVERIRQVCLQNGYEADLFDCANIWENYSDTLAAGWIGLPEDNNELWQEIQYDVEYKERSGLNHNN